MNERQVVMLPNLKNFNNKRSWSMTLMMTQNDGASVLGCLAFDFMLENV